MCNKYWLLAIGITLASTVIFLTYITTSPTYLYKIISVESWQKSTMQNKVVLSKMDNDFIHLSTKKQLDGIIKKFWKNIPEFFVLTLEVKKLPGKLVLETNPGGSNKYYHLYNGFIPTTSIISASKIHSTK